MKKSVIIDKGNGLQQRLSYDDSTNKIIPETTFGPRQTDNVLPVVGKKFIDETDLSVAYGEDCLFCKGKKNTSGIPFATQCAILSGVEVSYSPCFGKQHQTVLVNVKYKGIPLPPDINMLVDFYHVDGTGVRGFFFTDASVSGFDFSFYTHQNSVNTIQIRINTKFKTGECIFTFKIAGATVSEIYNDNTNMKIYYDPYKNLIKYVNSNKLKNKDYVDIVTNPINYFKATLTRFTSGKVYPFPKDTSLFYWTDVSLFKLTGAFIPIETIFNTNGIPVLGYESLGSNGNWTNLCPVIFGPIPRVIEG